MRFIILFFLITIDSHSAMDLNRAWSAMQKDYLALVEQFKEEQGELDAFFTHDKWHQRKKDFKSYLLGHAQKSFLSNDLVVSTMFVQKNILTQGYEELFLSKCISNDLKKILGHFRETDVGGSFSKQGVYACNVNSLRQIYYLARILDIIKANNICTIIELGGGYGALARIATMVLPELSYIIIDLPELLALQNVYLRMSQERPVRTYTTVSSLLQTPGIHLVPVYLLDLVHVNADLFISFFALSETPAEVQNIVLKKNFFGARGVYLTGQISSSTWNNESTILNGLRDQYKNVIVNPFHFQYAQGLMAYEAFGLV